MENAITVNGKTQGENVAGAENYNSDVIMPFDQPLRPKTRRQPRSSPPIFDMLAVLGRQESLVRLGAYAN